MKWFLIILLTALAMGVGLQSGFAQDEEFADEEEFAPPPPPPPGAYEEEPAPEPIATDDAPPAPSRFGGGSSGGSPNPSLSSVKKRRQSIPFNEAEPEDITNENYPDLIESFDYPNADIADVVKAISELTGRNFIIDPNIRGKITIIAPTQITKAEAYKAFLSALAMNGYTVVPYGKFLKIKSVNDAKRDNINTYSGSYSPDTDQMITRIIHLKHISAEEVNRSLRILVSTKGEMAPYAATNSLILTDFGSNITRIMNIISQLDVQGFEEKLSVIPIKSAKAKDIAALIEQIINKDATSGSTRSRRGSGGTFSSGIPRFGGSSNSNQTGSAFSMVIPDDRTNAIIVVGNTAGIDKIKTLVRQLDYPLNPEDAGGVYVYYMKHAEAKAVAEILNGIAKEQKDAQKQGGANDNVPVPVPRQPIADTSTGAGAFFGGDVKISADETINSLIITASKQDYDAVKALLEKIDIARNQVNVEVIVMEISNSNSKNWGASTYKIKDTGDVNANGIIRTGFNGGVIDQMLTKNYAADGFVLGFGTGSKVKVNLGGTEFEIPSLISFINLIQQVSDVNIMSTPNITVLDNAEAEIEVGETIPVSSAQTQTNVGNTSTPTREPATLKLKIKPRISPGSNAVRLSIQQTIKELSNREVKAKALADVAVVTSERNIKTEIVVNNKDTAIIGGLMRDEEQVSDRKVPLLGDIPVIGWLFKNKSRATVKRNLTMFITPKIIRTIEDVKELREEKLDERIDFIKRNMGGRDPFGKKADSIAKSNATSELPSGTTDDLIEEIDPTEPNTDLDNP
ncbi:MAG: type II secretion system secretin GspD [Bdellovibrionales bacterium]|nr:type II secretion system secretin GspD [Bdellovibrionales bacterium]